MKNAYSILNTILYPDITNIIINYVMISRQQVIFHQQCVNFTIETIKSSYRIFDYKQYKHNFTQLYFELRRVRGRLLNKRVRSYHPKLKLDEYYSAKRRKGTYFIY
jgi:hypothetical protein